MTSKALPAVDLSPQKFTLSLCYAAMMAMAISINLIPVLLTTLSVDLGGLTHEQLGRIGAATFAGVVAGIICTGPLVDRWGARYFALGANLLFASGLALFGTANGYPMVLLAVFIMGAGTGILDMILSPIVCALQPDRRATALNWLHSFYCLGAVLTVLGATYTLQAGLSWRKIGLGLASVPLVLAVGFACAYIPPMVETLQRRSPLRMLCRDPYFIAVMMVMFLSGASELGLAQWLPAYAESSLGFSRWTSGMALLGFSVAMTLARILVAWAGPRINPSTLIVKSAWLCVALVLLGALLRWPEPGLLACVLAGFAVSPLWPTTLGLAGDRFPNGGASMFGLLTAIGNLGGIFMPWAVGVAADYSTMRIGLALVALCPLCIGVLMGRTRATGARVELPATASAE